MKDLREIKPSEGRNFIEGTFLITGRIQGRKYHSPEWGGRYLVRISDIDPVPGENVEPILALNLNPSENHALPDDVKPPLSKVPCNQCPLRVALGHAARHLRPRAATVRRRAVRPSARRPTVRV